MSYDEALAPTNADAPVSCDAGHTSQTFAIGQLYLVSNGHLLAVDSDTVRDEMARRCPTQLAKYLGTTDDQLRELGQTTEYARWQLHTAQALLAGTPPPPRRLPCFVDPRHGPSVADVSTSSALSG